ncbi:hypothetical protein NUM3379_36970 [Kineococcus sp. NUM-3379]
MDLRAVAYADAVLAALADGALVAVSYVTEDLEKGRGTPRYRARVAVSVAYGALAAADWVGWELLTRPPGAPLLRLQPPAVEAADRRYLVVAGVGTGVLAVAGKVASARARRRGDRRPHRRFGVVAGIATTAVTLPVWLARARARVDAAQAQAAEERATARVTLPGAWT